MSDPVSRVTLPMPRLGETMEEGTIAAWLVQPGQRFRRGDALVELESDKTLVEYPALGDGLLVETLAEVGAVVGVGTPIAVIETSDPWDGIAGPAGPEPAPAQEAGENAATPGSDGGAADNGPAVAARAALPGAGPLRATPVARRIARQHGIALDQVTGTGRRARIEAADVRQLIASQVTDPAALRAAKTPAVVYCVHGFSGLGANWAALRASLQRGGIKTRAPDLPGHGRNPVAAGGVEVLIDWLAEDLAAQAEPVHLVGHSLGAHVAVRAALRVPSQVAGLTLIAPAGCGEAMNTAFIEGMAAAPDRETLAGLMSMLGPKAASLGDDSLSALAANLQDNRLSALARELGAGNVQRIDTLDPLRKLSGKMPVRAIFGLADRIIPRDHAFNLPPLVACHMVEAGHMPHWDATQTVAGIIRARP